MMHTGIENFLHTDIIISLCSVTRALKALVKNERKE